MTASSQRSPLHGELERALTDAVNARPRSQRPYAQTLAEATLAGNRSHGEQNPAPPPGLDFWSATQTRHAIDAAWDRVHTAHLQAEMRVRVRCYDDEVERDGTITAITHGASAPISVLVDYPDGYTRGESGERPINPSGYSLARIIRPRAPHAPQTPTDRLPLRRVAHEPGQAGEGLWLADGGLVTWSAADPAGCHGGRGRPPAVSAQRSGLHAATGGKQSAFAFNISAAGELRDDIQPLRRGEREAIGALALLAGAEARYCRFGWEQDPSFDIFASEREWPLAPRDHHAALRKLLAEGELHRGAAPRLCFQLPASARVALIDQRDLATRWEVPVDGPGHDPNHATLGAIPRARREARAEREQSRAFLAPLRQHADGHLPVRLHFSRATNAGELVVVWGPSSSELSGRDGQIRDGWQQLTTRVPASCGERVRAALLAEAERLMRQQIRLGHPMGAICDWLAGLSPDWLTRRAPALER